MCVSVCVWSEDTLIWRCTLCMMWHSFPTTNEDKCVLACTVYMFSPHGWCFCIHRQRHPETSGVILCNPNCMCFSFAQNNPKQLQGNSAQCTDKEPWVVSSGRTWSAPFQPWSIHYGITMITFWAPRSRHAWIHPPLSGTTPSYNTLFICLATSNFQLDAVWRSNNHILWCCLMVVIFIWLDFVRHRAAMTTPVGTLLRVCGWTYCSAPDASFLLSRKMMGWDENIPVPHSHTI